MNKKHCSHFPSIPGILIGYLLSRGFSRNSTEYYIIRVKTSGKRQGCQFCLSLFCEPL